MLKSTPYLRRAPILLCFTGGAAQASLASVVFSCGCCALCVLTLAYRDTNPYHRVLLTGCQDFGPMGASHFCPLTLPVSSHSSLPQGHGTFLEISLVAVEFHHSIARCEESFGDISSPRLPGTVRFLTWGGIIFFLVFFRRPIPLYLLSLGPLFFFDSFLWGGE